MSVPGRKPMTMREHRIRAGPGAVRAAHPRSAACRGPGIPRRSMGRMRSVE